MVRTKTAAKRSRGESSSSVQPPPEGHPQAELYQNMSDFNCYLTTFASRKVISPRYMVSNFFEKYGCPTLLEFLVKQNLVEFVKLNEPYYPDVMAAAYTTLELNISDDDLDLIFKIGKNTYSIDSSKLMELWNLDYSGHALELKDSHIEHEDDYTRFDACALFNIPFDIPKPTVGCLSLDHRLLHYLIVYVLVPRLHNHGLILEEDLDLMWRIAKGKKLNWVIIIATHMRRTKSEEVARGLPMKEINQGQVQEGEEEDQEMDDIQGEPQQAMEEAQEAPPQEQPSMMDLMRELQAINRNIGRLSRRVQRIEQSMGIQGNDEEDQD
ncbi:hypothetical protein PIB30_002555 [Stylosanthes scabra]|uniref:Uncharacterized protein n=1 Tax=Stylosanthes scabra TaxID=79078 RepID=A0ABU6Y516_9FABA|nr:hypothetical protein [Stylosanthes scabra]